MASLNKKKPCSTPKCGRVTQKDGLCYKCFKEKYGRAPYPGQDHKKKEANPSNLGTSKTCLRCKKIYQPTSNAQKHCPDCSIEIKRERDKSYKDKSQVSQGRSPLSKAGKKPSANDIGTVRGKDAEPESKEKRDKSEELRTRSDGKTAYLGQLLYASNLLDGQLNSAIESGDIDIKIILNIRSRLGYVLRGSFPAAEVPS